jgi:HEAT repeat protein
MTVGRTELALALDDMDENQDGVRFQRMALQLVRQAWPEVVCSEPGKDLGIDARIPTSLAADGVGRAFACSITPTYAKILADARKIRANYPSLKVMIFATPAGVSNQRAEGWIQELHKELGLELVILSREDLLSRLLEPASAPARQLLLGFAASRTPEFADLCSEVALATRENVDLWFAHRRLGSHPSLTLRFSIVGEDGKVTERIDQRQILELLEQHRHILLEAPPGSGKTTTLVQMARSLADHDVLPVLMHLPEWASSGQAGLADFLVAHSGPFQARGLQAAQVLQVLQQKPTVVLLNGWNELSSSGLDLIEQRLQAEERKLPDTGFLVATRGHRFRPPLEGLSRITIQRLNRVDRRSYLTEALGAAGDALADEIDRSPALNDLTRTPFILHEVMKLKRAGHALPATKMGILEQVTSLFEKSPEHGNWLMRAPLHGMASSYLSALAEEMTQRGDTLITEASARGICSQVSERLVQARQMELAAAPSDILGALTDHHVLERTIQATGNLQFEHQQFQEFYAAHTLHNALEQAVEATELMPAYQRDFINWPAWEESLRMLAEKIAGDVAATPLYAGAKAKLLVGMCAEVDLYFAATLARLCAVALPQDGRTALVDRLRRWYAVADEAHQELALAAIFETGFPEFADLVTPLLTSEDHQQRLRAYRNAREFHLSILGGEWQAIVSNWTATLRSDFVSELTIHGGRTDIAAYFALHDPDVEVRKASIRYLGWMRDDERLVRAIDALPACQRESVLLQIHTDEIPPALLAEVVHAHKQRLAAETDHVRRVQMILSGRELGLPGIADALKEELRSGGVEGFNHMNNRSLAETLTFIKETDGGWVSAWVASQVAVSALSYRLWGTLLTTVPDEVQQDLLTSMMTTELGHQQADAISVLASVIGVPLMEQAFTTYCDVKAQTQRANLPLGDVRYAIIRQLEQLFRETPSIVSVASMASHFDQPLSEATLRGITSLLGRGIPSGNEREQPLDLRPELPKELCEHLRQYLKQAVTFACELEDSCGRLIADLSSTLSRVGSPEDLIDLTRLLHADVARWTAIRAAQASGKRVQLTGWQQVHVRALLTLDAPDADEVLIALLNVDQYVLYAAKALLEFAQIEPEIPNLFLRESFRQIWLAREGKRAARFEEGKRQKYAAALRSCLEQRLVQVRATSRPEDHARLLHELAAILAILDGAASSPLICDCAAIADRSGGWHRAAALRQVLFSGGTVPFETAHAILESVLVQMTPQRYFQDDQGRGLVTSLLCLLPYTDQPERGIARIRQVLAEGRLYGHHLRGLVTALGHSRAPGALALLTEFAGPGTSTFSAVTTEWIEAVGNLGGRDGATTLLAFVETGRTAQNRVSPHDHHLFELAANRIAVLAQTDDELQSKILALVNVPGSPERDFVIIKTVAALSSLDAMLTTLNLDIEDRSHRWPYFVLEEAFQELCLIKRRTPPDSNSYTLEPIPAVELRRRLLEIATAGDRRSRNAFSLLGQIDVWRLEHGKPPREQRHPAIESGVQWPALELMNSLPS